MAFFIVVCIFMFVIVFKNFVNKRLGVRDFETDQKKEEELVKSIKSKRVDQDMPEHDEKEIKQKVLLERQASIKKQKTSLKLKLGMGQTLIQNIKKMEMKNKGINGSDSMALIVRLEVLKILNLKKKYQSNSRMTTKNQVSEHRIQVIKLTFFIVI